MQIEELWIITFPFNKSYPPVELSGMTTYLWMEGEPAGLMISGAGSSGFLQSAQDARALLLSLHMPAWHRTFITVAA